MPRRAPIHLRLGPSRLLAWGCVLLHAGGAACLWLSAVPVAVALVATLGLAALGIRLTRVHALRCAPSAVIGLVCRADAPWQLERRDGRRAAARPEPPWLVLPGLVVIPIREPAGTAGCLVVARDACEPDALRRLRVMMRTGT